MSILSKEEIKEWKRSYYDVIREYFVGSGFFGTKKESNTQAWALSGQIHKTLTVFLKRIEKDRLNDVKVGVEKVEKKDILAELENMILNGSATDKIKSADLLSKLQGFYDKKKTANVIFEVVGYGSICDSCEFDYEKLVKGSRDA